MNEMWAISGCAFASVGALAWWVISLLTGGRDDALRQRLAREEEQTHQTARQSLSSLLSSIGQAASKPFMPKTREKQSALKRQLGFAGIYAPAAVKTMQGIKVLSLLGGIFLGYCAGLFTDQLLLALSVFGLVGYLAPALWLRKRIGSNRDAIDRALPDALDLMVVCVEAGLTLDAAMQRVGQELSLAFPDLARELDLTHMETRIGVPRADALKNLGVRTGLPSLQMLATTLVQAERYGSGVAQALRVQAEAMRASRQFAAEEQAAKASVKLSFPVVLFIFPALLIVLAGPAAIGLMKSALFNQ